MRSGSNFEVPLSQYEKVNIERQLRELWDQGGPLFDRFVCHEHSVGILLLIRILEKWSCCCCDHCKFCSLLLGPVDSFTVLTIRFRARHLAARAGATYRLTQSEANLLFLHRNQVLLTCFLCALNARAFLISCATVAC